MTEKDRKFVTPNANDTIVSSATICLLGTHERLRVWVKGGLAGDLIVCEGHAAPLARAMGLVEVFDCPRCDGRGYIVVDASTTNEMVQDTANCDECNGTGESVR